MDKYGVEEVPESKTASTEGRKCPSCGRPLTDTKNVNVLHCGQCGTKPFEESNDVSSDT